MDEHEREHETAVFSAAIARLNIQTIDAPQIFGVTRQTLSNWQRGLTKVPKSAFVTLLELENETDANVKASITETVESVRERIDMLDEIAGRISGPNAEKWKELAQQSKLRGQRSAEKRQK